MLPLPFSLDRHSPTPLYYQLKEQLALLIRNGTYPPGRRLPSESEFVAQLGVSRGTVRQAIDHLVNEGRLKRDQGRGTFVQASPPSLHMAQRFTSFAEDMREMNVMFSTKVLDKKIIPASGRLVSKLNLQLNDEVIYLERLGEVEGEPFVLAFSYLPRQFCPDLLDRDLGNQSLYELIEQSYGLRLVRAVRTLESASADKHEARLLGIKRGAPIHFMHNLAYLDDGRPIEYSRLRFRGDRSRITFEVQR